MGAAYITVNLYVHATSAPRPPPAKPHVEEPTKPDKDPKPEGDTKTTGPSPPVPPEPRKPPRRCEVEWPDVVICSDVRRKYMYPTLKAALEAAIKKLPQDWQKRPFTTKGTKLSEKLPRPGVNHTTYKSADGRTKISIGCYKTCCENTEHGPVFEDGKCYELNTEDLR